LADAVMQEHVARIVETKRRGLVAQLVKTADSDDAEITKVLGVFVRPWEWVADD
jgi:hypothetical protein